ncbi:MAG: phosphatidate cytidylyltransferase, partial [Gammaproteobacteria bacterium]
QGSLKRRLLAAAVLLPAAILWVLFAPLPVYAGIAALLVFAAAWEWAALAGVTDDAGRAVYLFAALVLMGLGWWVHGDSTLVRGLLIAFALFWVLTAVDLCFPPPVGSASHTARLIQGLLVLAPAWFGFLVLRAEPNGTRLVIAFLAIVWAADASAYFTGRAWGLHRMAPNISPGKSWEGLAGGIVGGAIAGVIASLWCPVPIYTLVPLAVGTTLFSVVGDLAESRLKRAAGAKDSGRLIPGHGGLLDRIDSLCAAAPAFVLGFQLWAAR